MYHVHVVKVGQAFQNLHTEYYLSIIIFLDSTGINWKLLTILQSWLCFHIILLLHWTILLRNHVCNLRWTSILSKLEKSLKSCEHEIVFRGNIDPCNNTIMWKHNQLCNIVKSSQFMPVESKQNKNNKHVYTSRRKGYPYYRIPHKFQPLQRQFFYLPPLFQRPHLSRP